MRAYAKSFLKSYIFQDMEEGGKAWTDHLRMLLERLGMDDFDTVVRHLPCVYFVHFFDGSADLTSLLPPMDTVHLRSARSFRVLPGC